MICEICGAQKTPMIYSSFCPNEPHFSFTEEPQGSAGPAEPDVNISLANVVGLPSHRAIVFQSHDSNDWDRRGFIDRVLPGSGMSSMQIFAIEQLIMLNATSSRDLNQLDPIATRWFLRDSLRGSGRTTALAVYFIFKAANKPPLGKVSIFDHLQNNISTQMVYLINVITSQNNMRGFRRYCFKWVG